MLTSSPPARCVVVWLLIVWFIPPVTPTRAQEALEAYMTVARGVQKIDLKSGATEMLFEIKLREPLGIALDTTAGKVYWIDTDTRKIQRSNFDGSQVEDVVTTLPDQTRGLAIDPVDRYMYWTEWRSKQIVRATLEGTDIQSVLTGLSGPDGIAIDPLDRKIYWNDDVSDYIYRANLDGTEVEALAYAGRVSTNIALHLEEGKMYWVEGLEEKIFRANLNGTQVEEIIPGGMDLSGGIDIDPVERKLYFAEWGGGPGDFLIHRSNLDGTELEEFLFINLTNIQDMVLDPVSRLLFWTDSNFNRIQRANLDGTGLQDLLTRANWPLGIALDPESEKVYWADLSGRKISRSNLDGTEVEDIITGLINPNGLALDLEKGKMYWSSLTSSKIYRANLDGTDVEELISALMRFPSDIALDLKSGKLYWATRQPDRIRRSNLDGTEIEDLITTGLNYPYSISVDPESEKLYWTDVGTYKILRSNLDGTEIEDLFDDPFSYPRDIALDLKAGKIYWTESRNGQLLRSNLDGSEIEEVALNLIGPQGFVLRAGSAPQITSYPISSVAVGTEYEYQVEASGFPDPVFSLEIAPSGMGIDANTGLITWVPPETGHFTVIVRASNGISPDNTQAFEIAVNLPPLITSNPVLTGTTGQPYRYEVTATGVPPPTFALTVSPEGMEIDDTTGVITWDPVVFGEHDVTVLATNGTPPDVTQSFILSIASGIAVESGDIPDAFDVLQNYPNPFSQSTLIEYRLPESRHVRVEIYDMLGRQVDVLVASPQPQGKQQIVWKGLDHQGRAIPAGLYFLLVETEAGERQIRTMTKVK